jgi:hypothetical protein
MEIHPVIFVFLAAVTYLGWWGFGHSRRWYWRRQQWKSWAEFQALRRSAQRAKTER